MFGNPCSLVHPQQWHAIQQERSLSGSVTNILKLIKKDAFYNRTKVKHVKVYPFSLEEFIEMDRWFCIVPLSPLIPWTWLCSHQPVIWQVESVRFVREASLELAFRGQRLVRYLRWS
jgi:hypothetical protein